MVSEKKTKTDLMGLFNSRYIYNKTNLYGFLFTRCKTLDKLTRSFSKVLQLVNKNSVRRTFYEVIYIYYISTRVLMENAPS